MSEEQLPQVEGTETGVQGQSPLETAELGMQEQFPLMGEAKVGAGKQVKPASQAEVGVEESEAGTNESETSTTDTSTTSDSSARANGSITFKSMIWNLLLAVFVVLALIAHVQLGKSELLKPGKAGGIHPPSRGADEPEESKVVEEEPKPAALVPEFAEDDDFLSESEDELNVLTDDGDSGGEEGFEDAQDRSADAAASASEGTEEQVQEGPLPADGPQDEPAGTRTADFPSLAAQVPKVQGTEEPLKAPHTPEAAPQEEPGSKEAAKSVQAGEDKFPQQEVPVPPVLEILVEEPADESAQQDASPSDASPQEAAEETEKKLAVRTLISRLTETKFETPFVVTKDDLEPYKAALEGPPEDTVPVQGFPVPRKLLQDFLSGRWLDVSVLQIYSNLISAHIDGRVAQGLQPDVAVLNPSELSIAWQLFINKHQIPKVDPSSIQRCLTADRVVFAMASPLWDWVSSKIENPIGHFVVAVIDRREHRVSVVDSLPHPRQFYTPILEFIKHVAQQLHDPTAGPVPEYETSPHVPELDLANACGAFSMENLLCIAEGRRPNYRMSDAKRIRLRMRADLFSIDAPMLEVPAEAPAARGATKA
ncbi:hypothetical protein, conserved [Eimeria brunetti]|uniref:Ubiquitin-like protease family profile domain-containing protein n=1 Tax=Eimeria brunetti TaxID=51314 RepID=U6LKF4_9EIME|nr:hypothetical protein, conserved [Eimeria brunetti]